MNHKKTVEKQHSVTNHQQKLSKFSAKNSLIIGIGVGMVISLGITRFISPLAHQESIAASQSETPATTSSNTAARYVTVTEVATNRVARSLKASGTVEAYELIPVMSQATGLQIQEILVDYIARTQLKIH